jgi:hypothetical protein
MSAPLPPRPDLDQLRRQAKDLLRASRAGDAAGNQRIRAIAPLRAGVEPTLSAAQLAIAREYGQPSWPALVAEVQLRNQNLIDRLTDLVVGSVGGHFDAPAAQRRWQSQALQLIADDPAIPSYDLVLGRESLALHAHPHPAVDLVRRPVVRGGLDQAPSLTFGLEQPRDALRLVGADQFGRRLEAEVVRVVAGSSDVTRRRRAVDDAIAPSPQWHLPRSALTWRTHVRMMSRCSW